MSDPPPWFAGEVVALSYGDFFGPLSDMVPEGASLVFTINSADPSPNAVSENSAFANFAPWKGMMDWFLKNQFNIYLSISAFNVLGTKLTRKGRSVPDVNRRGENWAAGLTLILDDLTLKVDRAKGRKASLSILNGCEPTALVETSPDNYQAWFFLREACLDLPKFTAAARAMSRNADMGCGLVSQIARPPWGLNKKRKHMRNGQYPSVRCVHWNPQRRFTIEQLVDDLSLDLTIEKPRKLALSLPSVGEEMELLERFKFILERIKAKDLLLSRDRRRAVKNEEWQSYQSPHGFTVAKHQMLCPFADNHTKSSDGQRGNESGAVLWAPNPQNHMSGSFRCAHDNCGGIKGDGPVVRTIGDLFHVLDPMDTYSTKLADDLEAVNSAPWEF